MPEFVLVPGHDELRVEPADHAQQIVGPAVGHQHVDPVVLVYRVDPFEVFLIFRIRVD